MNNMNAHESIVGKAVQKIADGIAGLAVNPRGCFAGVLFEPEIPEAVIDEIVNTSH